MTGQTRASPTPFILETCCTSRHHTAVLIKDKSSLTAVLPRSRLMQHLSPDTTSLKTMGKWFGNILELGKCGLDTLSKFKDIPKLFHMPLQFKSQCFFVFFKLILNFISIRCLTDAKEGGSEALFQPRSRADVLPLQLDAFLFRNDLRNTVRHLKKYF